MQTLFIKCFCVPDVILGAGNTWVSKDKVPALKKITFFWGTNHKQTIYISEGLSIVNIWGMDVLGRT